MMRYIESLPAWGRVVVSVMSFAVMWVAILMFMQFTRAPDAYVLSGALMVSIVVHEMGHLLAYKRHGISSMLVFLIIVGGTIPLDARKANRLSDTAQAEVDLAGLTGNMVIMGAAFLGHLAGVIPDNWAGKIINMNAALMLFNMIPISSLDGSRFMAVLFHNVSPKLGKTIFHITAVPVLFGMMLVLYMRGSVVFALPLILIGTRIRSHHPEGTGYPTRQMSNTARLIWIVLYLYLVGAALCGYVLTPDWAK